MPTLFILPLFLSVLLLLPATLPAQSPSHGHGHHDDHQAPQRVLPPAPEPGSLNDFVDTGKGTVTDRMSGLMWKKCSEGQTWEKTGNSCTGDLIGYTWDEALDFVEALNQSDGDLGYKDWRLPTIKELATLVDYNRRTPIAEEMFPNTPGRWFWSSTPFHRATTYRAWFVAFGYGDISIEKIDNKGLFVRLVRNAD